MNVERKSISVLRQLTAVVCLFAVLVLWPLRSAQAGLIHASTPDADYIAYGDTFNYAGMLAIAGDTPAEDTFRGSLGYLGGGWFISAVHNLIDVPTDQSTIFDNFAVSMGSNFFDDRGDTFYIGKDDWYLHPGYLGTASGPDIALGYSEEAKNALSYVDPIALYEGPDVLGSELAFVGFGDTGTGNAGVTGFDGQKRAGRNEVTGLGTGGDNVNYRNARFYPTSFSDSNPLGMLMVNGDSGGLVIDDSGPIDRLVGIISYRAGPEGYFGSTGFSRISLEREFILETTSQVPEPATGALMGIAAVAVGLRRRKAGN